LVVIFRYTMTSCYMCQRLPIDRPSRLSSITRWIYDCSICGKRRIGDTIDESGSCPSCDSYHCIECLGGKCKICQYKPCRRIKSKLQTILRFSFPTCIICDGDIEIETNGPLTCRDLTRCKDCIKNKPGLLCSDCVNPATCPTRYAEPVDEVIIATDRLSITVQKIATAARDYDNGEPPNHRDYNLCPICNVFIHGDLYHEQRMHVDLGYKFRIENYCPFGDSATCQCLKGDVSVSCLARREKLKEIRKKAHQELHGLFLKKYQRNHKFHVVDCLITELKLYWLTFR